MRRKTSPLVVLVLILAVAAIAVGLYLNSRAPSATVPATQPAAVAQAPAASVDLLLGNPSGATADAGNRANYLMIKRYYALSYNELKGTPNWVSWRVTGSDLGHAPRKQVFDTDGTLPASFYHVTHKDYSGSGYDRGHMCPHSDRAANQEMSFATFVMTNIIPQAPVVNEKTWAYLEEYCRTLVSRGRDHLYIIAGPAGSKGTIAHGRVNVPAECWKIIVVVPAAGSEDDLAKITPLTRVIAVVMPNDQSIGMNWRAYRTTPAEVETRTGLHFFDRVRPDIADVLRQKLDHE